MCDRKNGDWPGEAEVAVLHGEKEIKLFRLRDVVFVVRVDLI